MDKKGGSRDGQIVAMEDIPDLKGQMIEVRTRHKTFRTWPNDFMSIAAATVHPSARLFDNLPSRHGICFDQFVVGDSISSGIVAQVRY